MFRESFKDVSRKFQGQLKAVLMNSKGVLRKFKGVLKKVQGRLKEVSRVFHENFKEEYISRMFQGCFMIFKGVSGVFQRNF